MANIQDLWLLTVSIGVAMMASAVAASSGSKAHFWVTGSLISLAAGLWALQFIGMLALGLPIQMSYDVPITLISLLIAVLVAGFALCTANVALEKRTRELSAANAALEKRTGELSAANVALEKQTGEFSTANVLLLEQIQERVQAEHALCESEKQLSNYRARHDMLTGLPNLNLFRDRLVHAMARAKRNGMMLATMVFDLDRFKEINDTLGHATGDRVLEAVARVIKESLREIDTIARLGADEFTLILEDIVHVDRVKAMAERILHILSDPIVIEGREIYVTASIGITLYPCGVEKADTLLQSAGVAMHHAKAEGGNTFEFFVPEMNAHAPNLDMENLLRRALERQEFTLHYQPKVSVKSGRITGMEALIRWNSKELGSVSPAKFIPLAEKTGLIVPIGEWVLRTACAQNKAWQQQGLPPLLMSVNLSPRQFRQKNLLERVTAGLRDSGLDARFLELEITESTVMLRPEQAVAILQDLHQFGVQLSVDDFGTGYSSLAYLKRFPVQKLKIDQSFMRDLTVDRDDAGIVTAVVAMAKSLKLEVIAEGVETAEQLAFLAKLECDEYQGYYFSRPVPAGEFARLFLAADDAARLNVRHLVPRALR